MSEKRTKYLKIGDKIGTVNIADEQRGMIVMTEVLYGGAINRASKDGPQFLKGADYAKKLQEFWNSDAGKDYVIYDADRIIADHQRAKKMYEAYFAKLRAEEAAKKEAIREDDTKRVMENMAQDKNSDAAKLLRLKKEAEEKRIAAEQAAMVPTTPLRMAPEQPKAETAPKAEPEKTEAPESAPAKAEPSVPAEPVKEEPKPEEEHVLEAPIEAPKAESAPVENEVEQEPVKAEEKAQETVTEESAHEHEEPKADASAVKAVVDRAVEEEADDEPAHEGRVSEAPVSEELKREEPAPVQEKAPVQGERLDDDSDDADEEAGPATKPVKAKKKADAEQRIGRHSAPLDEKALKAQMKAENVPQTVELVLPKWCKVVSIIGLIMLILLTVFIVLGAVVFALPIINYASTGGLNSTMLSGLLGTLAP